MVQLTRFKCGGVRLGFTNEHHTSDMVRNRSRPNRRPSSFRVLSVPRPRFHQHPPPLKTTPLVDGDTTTSTFRLSRDHIKALNQKCSGDEAGVSCERAAEATSSFAAGIFRQRFTLLKIGVGLLGDVFGESAKHSLSYVNCTYFEITNWSRLLFYE